MQLVADSSNTGISKIGSETFLSWATVSLKNRRALSVAESRIMNKPSMRPIE